MASAQASAAQRVVNRASSEYCSTLFSGTQIPAFVVLRQYGALHQAHPTFRLLRYEKCAFRCQQALNLNLTILRFKLGNEIVRIAAPRNFCAEYRSTVRRVQKMKIGELVRFRLENPEIYNIFIAFRLKNG